MDKYQQIMAGVSQTMYTLLRGSAKGSGWHDKAEYHFNHSQYKKHVGDFYQYLSDNDLVLPSYCILACTLARSEHFRSPMRLYGRVDLMRYLRELREYCGSSESFVEVADLIYHLLEYQGNLPPGDRKSVFFTFNNLLKDVDVFLGSEDKQGTKYLQTYYTLVDRIQELKESRIDPKLWIVAKYEKCVKAFKDNIAFSVLANNNSLEPDLSKLKQETNDEWRDIRQFLGVSLSCEFPDESVPKGWRPASGDRDKIDDIVKITRDGYYYYPDGSQRRGKRHYMNNSYMVINCTPENFEEFKGSWDDPRLLTKMPTWEEYSKYGPEEKHWGEDGSSLNERGKPVTWRKK